MKNNDKSIITLLIMGVTGLTIVAIITAVNRDKLIDENQSVIIGNCEITSTTIAESICSGDICTVNPCKCFYGVIHWKLDINNNTYYTDINWRNTFAPAIGIRKYCWYKQNAITFENPQEEVDLESYRVIVVSVIDGILAMTLFIYLCCVCDCRIPVTVPAKKEKPETNETTSEPEPIAINPQAEGQTNV